jgi:hypothetical protein
MIALLLLLLLTSCIKTEVIGYEPIPPVEYRKKPHKELPADSTDTEDTTRMPITFNPSVEDWEEIEENL